MVAWSMMARQWVWERQHALGGSAGYTRRPLPRRRRPRDHEPLTVMRSGWG
jgi:hypothetical protein